ncbi:hypothetical protein PSAL_003370 [Pseudooceanicola algae]|uniref:KAP NTPase domain-containing protein n=2 Tax=Pseudooceanicola algae TaxID=1537215 RepID=A0A418SKE5_9RHOB|nr:hypothetical protein PSAL_003370 [Pseudooceanicola algae]
MRLTLPTAKCEIYVDGFSGQDLLGRAETGKQLTALVDRLEDPVVIALDGPWGSGKSYFLQRWAGAHHNEFSGNSTVIYLDAFKNDYLDDPLIALTAAIADRFEKAEEAGRGRSWERAKRAAVSLSRPAFRIGLAMGTAGLSEVVGPALDAALKAAGEDIEQRAEDAFWAAEQSRRAAMEQFRGALDAITAGGEGEDEGSPIVIVVDELDRCRPDYALAMLEVAKHFFSVPRVHFVLGVNMNALQHIVRARYGVSVDAAEYLKRFVSIVLNLPESSDQYGRTVASYTYFEAVAARMEIPHSISKTLLGPHVKLLAKSGNLSLRDVERLLSHAVLVPDFESLIRYRSGYQVVVASCLILKALRPELYDAAIKNSIAIEQIDDFYGITAEMIGADQASRRSGKFSQDAMMINKCWSFIISGGESEKSDEKRELLSRMFDEFGDVHLPSFVRSIGESHFSNFRLIG